jgi:tRNA G37 N-methylase Trm5
MIMGDCSSLLGQEILNQLSGNEQVLDVGAGTGYYSLQIAKKLNIGKVLP